MNKKLSFESGIAPLKDLNGNFNFSDLDKAELLNRCLFLFSVLMMVIVLFFHSRLSPSSPGINDINTLPCRIDATPILLGDFNILASIGQQIISLD